MCFTVHSKYPSELTAKKDIKVWKVGTIDKRVKTFHPAYYFSYTYKKGQLQKEVPTLVINSNNEIWKGYHSYETWWGAFESAIGVWVSQGIWMKIKRFTIPKGSKYYYNPFRKEYVSNQIIYK